jgi:hypothetical protein
MAEVRRTVASLRFVGDDLDPDLISRMLGALPTASVCKGDVRLTPKGREIVAYTGIWRLEADCGAIDSLDRQIASIFDGLSDDLSAWRELAARYRGDIFAGLFLHHANEGLSLEPSTLAAIGERNLMLDFDIYSGTDDDEGDDRLAGTPEYPV